MSIDDAIWQAMQAGKFDDLSGKGKLLRLEDDTHVDPEWRLAYHVLKEGGYSLPWIELRQEIDAEIDAARSALRRAWEHKSTRVIGEAEWQHAQQAFSGRVEGINRRIRDYNLQVPGLHFQMQMLNVQREIAGLSAK